MKLYITYIIPLLIFAACQNTFRFDPVQLDTAINKTGIVQNHSFDQTKPKVITYFGSVDYFASWLTYCSNNYIKDVATQYEDFEFIFYLRLSTQIDLDKAIKLVRRNNIDMPIYIDNKDKFRNKNVGEGSKVGVVTYIIDSNNKGYLSTVLGFGVTNFDRSMQQAIKQIKLENNGL